MLATTDGRRSGIFKILYLYPFDEFLRRHGELSAGGRAGSFAGNMIRVHSYMRGTKGQSLADDIRRLREVGITPGITLEVLSTQHPDVASSALAKS